MRKIWTIASKELYTTFTDRTLILIMIVTPLLLSTIIALAFGGGGDPDTLSIGEIPIVIVNQDDGLDMAGSFGVDQLSEDVWGESLFGLGIGQDAGTDEDAAAFNAGDLLVTILAPERIEEGDTAPVVALPECTMIAGSDSSSAFDTTLAELFSPALLDDPALARQAVEQGDYVAAIIIPAGFSQTVMPIDQFGPSSDEPKPEAVVVEVYANAGNPIEAAVVRAVVEGAVGQFGRMGLAVFALSDTVGQTLVDTLDLSAINLAAVPAMDAPVGEWQTFLNAAAEASPWLAALAGTLDQLATEDAWSAGSPLGDEIGGALACLFDPDAGTVTVNRQPLNELQAQSIFQQVMVQIGSAQAVFFALFTGAFGILGIYQERKQWTLQRMLVSPTSKTSVLGGFLSGNVVVVWAQLVLLMFFLTLISSFILRQPTVIWGSEWLLLLLLTIAVSICVSGIGVLIVGIARTPEQVNVFAPVVNIFLGALGGAFGFQLPPVLASLSLITWATDAYRQLAAGQTDIWLNLAVLALQGVVFFGIGLWLFKRRVNL